MHNTHYKNDRMVMKKTKEKSYETFFKNYKILPSGSPGGGRL